MLERFSGDIFHYQKRCAVFVDPHVEELHDGRMGELSDEPGFLEEPLFQVPSKAINEGFEGYRATDDIIASFFDAARSTRADQFKGFVPASLQCNH